jgi:hypothetical protein
VPQKQGTTYVQNGSASVSLLICPANGYYCSADKKCCSVACASGGFCPVGATDITAESNALPFTIGNCQEKEIGCLNDYICCPEVICHTSDSECAGVVNSSSYSWEFTTTSMIMPDCASSGGVVCGTGCCTQDHFDTYGCGGSSCYCGEGMIDCETVCCPTAIGCNDDGTACASEVGSCSGKQADVCAATEYCPNQPGKCQVSSFEPTDSCACSAGYTYSATQNKCQLTDSTCGIKQELGGYIFKCTPAGTFEAKFMGGACPAGSYMGIGVCILGTPDHPTSCTLCAAGQTCLSDNPTADNGSCYQDTPLCPVSTSCSGAPDWDCWRSDQCSCCCEVGQDTQQC